MLLSSNQGTECAAAARARNLEVLKWLKQRKERENCRGAAANQAAERGHLEFEVAYSERRLVGPDSAVNAAPFQRHPGKIFYLNGHLGFEVVAGEWAQLV